MNLKLLLLVFLQVICLIAWICTIKKQENLLNSLLQQNKRLLEEKVNFLRKKSKILDIIDDAKRHKENYLETIRKIEKELYSR